MKTRHHYIERETRKVAAETLYRDATVTFLYDRVRESMPAVFRLLTGAHASRVLGFLNYDAPFAFGCRRFMRAHRIAAEECIDDPTTFTTLRQLFERKINYWRYRPMPNDANVAVSPADARVLVGSLASNSVLFVKDKFFSLDELLADDRPWVDVFAGGDYALFRLTPEKYHYNHAPVSGRVRDIYEIRGGFHSCNPGAVVRMVTPYSKNTRVVTVIDTDVPGGTGIGYVAMIEIVALMIGDIVQCYSETAYRDPQPVTPGMFLRRGCPKSLFRPGSSTTLVLFEQGRVRFADDLLENQMRADVDSRYSLPFGRALIETDIKLRSVLAYPLAPEGIHTHAATEAHAPRSNRVA